jgi:putative DNA primase/helicase
VCWLWPEYLPARKVSILAGAPSTGKTTLALWMAATITRGAHWPIGGSAPVGDVLIWSGEDALSDTLIPRLLACGAEMSRIHFISGMKADDGHRAFDPAYDIDQLRGYMLDRDRPWQLLIVDSIVSAVAGDSHKNAEVRRGLEPLALLADVTGCAVLGISHFTKGTAGREPVERVTGSLAFGAFARMVLATAKQDQQLGGSRILTRAKSNLGPDGGGFLYDIEQVEVPGYAGIFASHIHWGDAIEGTAREILADAEALSEDQRSERGDVDSWLREMLAECGGSLDKKSIMAAAKASGHHDRTVQRARERLGIVTQMAGFGVNKHSIWSLPILPDGTSHTCQSSPIVPIVPHVKCDMIGTNGTDARPEVEGALAK